MVFPQHGHYARQYDPLRENLLDNQEFLKWVLASLWKKLQVAVYFKQKACVKVSEQPAIGHGFS